MIHKVAFIVLVIGGLNWLVFALSGWEVGQLVGGMDAIGAKVIYIVVGLAAVYELLTHGKNCAQCKAGKSSVGDNSSMQQNPTSTI
jgi:uncharacterized protein